MKAAKGGWRNLHNELPQHVAHRRYDAFQVSVRKSGEKVRKTGAYGRIILKQI